MSRSEHSHRDGARIAMAVLVSAACLLVAPSSGVANGYHDFLCRIPYGPEAGRPAPAEDVAYEINSDFLYVGDSCPEGGSLYAAMDGGVTHPYTTRAMDTFTAPAGLTIAGFTVWRYEAAGPSQVDGTAESKLEYIPGPPSVEALCDYGCSRGTQAEPLNPENEVSVTGLSGVSKVRWNAACGGGPGGTCPESGSRTLSAQFDVYAADIDLVDDTPPTVSDVGGPLVAGGTLDGEQTVSFEATDDQSGVYGGSLVVDGHTVVSRILDTNEGHCQSLGITTDGQRSFEYAQPCEASVSASLTLNTNQLTAGQHSLELIVEDAAGNQAIAYNGTIITSGPPLVTANGGSINGAATSNSSPGSSTTSEPSSATAGKGAANGEPCAGEELSLTVNGQAKPPTVVFGKPVLVRGVLHCGTVPIRNARIAITTAGGPASAAIDTSVQTGLDGSFSYRVPTGPSRTLDFAYTAYSNDPEPSATATATIAIQPVIELRIGPRRTRNGHTIYWTGTIAGGPYPDQGVTLDVEVREGRHWKIFAQIVADEHGRFHYSYRFHATTEPVTYTFRLAMPDTGSRSYPYAPGASNTVNVGVTP